MNPRNIAKRLLPPILLEWWRIIQSRRGRGLCFSGDYCSWEEARLASTGYDSVIILEKTKAALLKVKNGEAIYERDSLLFDKIQYAWPILAGLMWVAAKSHGRLNVLDFGGSLGTTYYQNRVFLRDLSEVRWNIIEQTAHVNVGKEYFEDDILKFFPNIETCLSDTQPNVILISGVLQNLENPYEILDKMLGLPIEYIIIDRTPFWDGPKDRLCVQRVPPTIYSASYPIWIFSEKIFLPYIQERKFETVAEFQGFDDIIAPVLIVWKGMIGKKKIH